MYFRIKKLLNQQLAGIDVYQNLYIENAIANIYAENSYFKKSIELFEDILKQLEVLHDNEEFEVKVRYNHAKALYLDNQYEESLYQVNKAIEISCRINSMALIGQLYYQRGECLGSWSTMGQRLKMHIKRQASFDILEMHTYKEALVNKISR